MNIKYGNIYKLSCNVTNKIYIGSTRQPLNSRLSQHKYFYNQYLSGERHYYRLYRLRHPRLYCQVFMNNQNNGVKDNDSNSDGIDNQSVRSVL